MEKGANGGSEGKSVLRGFKVPEDQYYRGVSQNLPIETILGVSTKTEGEIMFLVKFKKLNNPEFIDLSTMYQQYSYDLEQYYQTVMERGEDEI
ncbi:hypothetical protein ACOME3_005126 [Neoechinorhynchus agilis]